MIAPVRKKRTIFKKQGVFRFKQANNILIKKIYNLIPICSNMGHLSKNLISFYYYINKSLMQTKSSLKIANFKQYQVNYDILSEYQLSLTVCNMEKLIKYSQNKIKLQHMNTKGFQLAMSNHKDFCVQFKEVDEQGEGSKKYLEIKLLFKSAFLKNVPEVINLPFKCNVSELDFFVEKAHNMQHKIRKIQEDNAKKIKCALFIDQKAFKSNYNQMNEYGEYDQGYNQADCDIKQFFTFDVEEEGKYFVEISMLVKCLGSNYFYFYLDKNYQTCFNNGAFFIPVTNQFVPLKFSFIHNCQKSNVFHTYDTYDYPFESRNIVVSATKLK